MPSIVIDVLIALLLRDFILFIFNGIMGAYDDEEDNS